MPKITADEVGTMKHHRSFLQKGGARPNNPVSYGGQDAQYMSITGVSNPDSGGVDPIRVHDPRRPGQYRTVGRSVSAPDLPEATLTMYERHGSIPWQLLKSGCSFNFYEVVGTCKDPSDFVSGWSDYVQIYSGALRTDKDLGDRQSWDSDDAIEDSLTCVLSDIYPVGSLGFGEQAATEISSEVIDIVYGSQIQCGDCGAENDGSKWIYAVAKFLAPSATNPTEVLYSTDSGATWSNVTLGSGDETPVAIDVVGNYLVVFMTTKYYWSEINLLTGVPGSFTAVAVSSWSSHNAADVYVSTPREVFVCAADGYIYKSTDILSGFLTLNDGSATSVALKRIAGQDETIVAVGASGTIIVSNNRGETFAGTTSNPSADTIQAICVLDRYRWWVGTGAGELYYTLNGGESWTEQAFSGSGSGNVYDIVAATDEVMFFSHSTTTPDARVWGTWNGGANWTRSAPRFLNAPIYDKANRIAVPSASESGIAANNVAIGGLGGNGTDGIILIGKAAII